MKKSDQFQQNRLFQNNQKRLFEKLEGLEHGKDEILDEKHPTIYSIKSLHPRISAKFDECLTSGHVPTWHTKGGAVLIMKHKPKRNAATNYRPITFSSNVEATYQHLIRGGS